MSFHFSQVLAGSDKDTKQDLKIESTDLQRRRAAKRTRKVARPTFISSFLSSNAGKQSLASNTDLLKSQQHSSNRDGRISCPSLLSSSPLLFASGCISNAIDKDSSTPPLYEVLSKYAVDNYNYNPTGPLGAFSRFEKCAVYNIPDGIFQKYKSIDCVTGMGVFTELEKAWITVDNKLIIWNYKTSSGSSSEQEFYTIDSFKSTILTVSIVKPKPKVFVKSVNYLLLVSTASDIHILALQNSKDHLDISDTKMSVSTQGLIVNKFATYDRTSEIFFTGAGDSQGIWKLNYTNEDEWFNRNCSKECLTQTSVSSLLPSIFKRIPNMIGGATKSNSKVESIIELKIDQSRGILYTLSSKSIIHAYRLKVSNGKTTLGYRLTKRPFDLLKDLSTTTVNMNSPLLTRNKFRVVSIFPVSKRENMNLFLEAVTSNGCRIYLNGSTMYGDRLTLTANQAKFPPPDLKFYESIERKKQQQMLNERSFMSSGSLSAPSSKHSITKNPIDSFVTVQDLRQAQESSNLLADISKALVISPGVFIGLAGNKKMFTCVPDYGILKNSGQYIEDFEIIDKPERVLSIVQLTPDFRATNRPQGYCNEFASQYSGTPLKFAVLTGTGIHVYRYRTPDLILEDSLNDRTFEQFSKNYGSDEACSSALYLSCKYGKSADFRSLATKYFITGGRNASLIKRVQPTINDVDLSDQFFATIILVSRLLRTFWNREVFTLKPDVKFTRSGYIDVASIKKMKEHKVILRGLQLNKQQLEYFLCSILIIIKYFDDNKKILPSMSDDSATSWKEKESEVCRQAEQLGFNAVLRFLNTVKEGLSFLTVLLDDDPKSKNFENIMSYLSIQAQADLSCLTFSEFFASSDPYVSKLIKEILSAIINKSIASGNSVEAVANTLQEKCGSFCSTGDVLIFKAIECLKKARDYANSNDQEMKLNYLEAAVKLLTKTRDSLSEETLTDSVNMMLSLEYYDGAVKFLLDAANSPEQIKLSSQYEKQKDSQMLKNTPEKKAYERRLSLYQMIFQILSDIDKKTVLSLEQASDATGVSSADMMLVDTDYTAGNKTVSRALSKAAFIGKDGQLITHYSQMRDRCYKICLSYKDKLFHYNFYRWFISNGVGERLLDIDTPYILGFLQDWSVKDLNIAKLLWVYYSRREKYFEAASVMRDLALSKFKLSLTSRIEYLSRANGFCRCIPAQSLHRNVIVLSSEINDLLAVSNLQDELLMTITNDPRIKDAALDTAQKALGYKILTVSELYNDYVDPLGYYELALMTFKISDYRNSEDILSKWESIFDKWFYEYQKKSNAQSESFYAVAAKKFVPVASRFSNTDVLFPIVDVFQIFTKYVYSKEFAGEPNVPKGTIISTFIDSGFPYDKLYYNLRGMIEGTTFELFDGYTNILNGEMCYLISRWYQNDKKLRDSITDDSIKNLQTYSVEKDPVYEYIKATGNPL